jgi:hypothetical protein
MPSRGRPRALLFRAVPARDLVAPTLESLDPFVDAGRRLVGPGVPGTLVHPGHSEHVVKLLVGELPQQVRKELSPGFADMGMAEGSLQSLRNVGNAARRILPDRRQRPVLEIRRRRPIEMEGRRSRRSQRSHPGRGPTGTEARSGPGLACPSHPAGRSAVVGRLCCPRVGPGPRAASERRAERAEHLRRPHPRGPAQTTSSPHPACSPASCRASSTR